MSRKPTLEVVDDDDIDSMMDIAEFDPSLRTPVAPLRPEPSVVRSQDADSPFPFPMPTPSNNTQPQQNRPKNLLDPRDLTDENRKQLLKFQIIYPCYFDVQRSHKEGRRVNEDKAVFNPLAKTISEACVLMGLPALLELEKTHPQDMGNPGRVRVLIKDHFNDGRVVDSRYQNKRKLLNDIAEYLQKHPTTLENVKKGIMLPPGYETFEPLELPTVRGFKMNTIVPVHSNYTLKHPMTKNVYDLTPVEDVPAAKPIQPQQPKKKIVRLRG